MLVLGDGVAASAGIGRAAAASLTHRTEKATVSRTSSPTARVPMARGTTSADSARKSTSAPMALKSSGCGHSESGTLLLASPVMQCLRVSFARAGSFLACARTFQTCAMSCSVSWAKSWLGPRLRKRGKPACHATMASRPPLRAPSAPAAVRCRVLIRYICAAVRARVARERLRREFQRAVALNMRARVMPDNRPTPTAWEGRERRRVGVCSASIKLGRVCVAQLSGGSPWVRGARSSTGRPPKGRRAPSRG